MPPVNIMTAWSYSLPDNSFQLEVCNLFGKNSSMDCETAPKVLTI